MVSRLAVIGGGPKAAAIAAKAAVLTRRKIHAFEVTVFEKDAAGAAWDGTHGYTDGEQALCTPAERDVGFPYDAATFGAPVVQEMLHDFSWQRFKIEQSGDAVRQWVSRGRKPPRHGEFARYLEFVLDRSQCIRVSGTVTRLDYDNAKSVWHVDVGGIRHGTAFDGVVVTGPGPALPHLPGADRKVVFDGEDFWQRLKQVKALLAPPHGSFDEREDSGVAIIGNGGTAGAVAGWFLRNGYNHLMIRIVGTGATIFSRRPGYFEDRFFGADEDWGNLGWEIRARTAERLTRGYLWEEVAKLLEQGGTIEYKSASAKQFIRSQAGGGSELQLEISCLPLVPGGKPRTDYLPARVFVDARGFDAWWFASLVSPAAWPDLHNVSKRPDLAAGIGEGLALPGGLPHLHVPMLAWAVGPAAGNLMALGWVADRILNEYVPIGGPYMGNNGP